MGLGDVGFDPRGCLGFLPVQQYLVAPVLIDPSATALTLDAVPAAAARNRAADLIQPQQAVPAVGPAFGSLLELTEACDVPVSFGCRSGACHYCQSGRVMGKVSYQPEPLEQPPPGCALICCSQPRADLALDL